MFRGRNSLHHLIGVSVLSLSARTSITSRTPSRLGLLPNSFVAASASPRRPSCHIGHSVWIVRWSSARRTLRSSSSVHPHATHGRQVFLFTLHSAKEEQLHQQLEQSRLVVKSSFLPIWSSIHLHLRTSRTKTRAAFVKSPRTRGGQGLLTSYFRGRGEH